MAETHSLVTTKMEFFVDFNRQEQVGQLRRALADCEEIGNVNIDLSSKRLVLDTSLQPSEIQSLIEQTLATNVVLLDSNVIHPIDPPLPLDRLNLDEHHSKPLFTNPSHSVSEAGVGGELAQKLESSSTSVTNQVFPLVLNSQADKPATEIRDTRPKPGNIYMLRVSIREAFGILESEKPEVSSFASCASSSSSTKGLVSSSQSSTKQKNKRYLKRPCIVLFALPESIGVLPITRFHRHDPTSINTDLNILLPELPRDYVLKHLLSIYPNPPVLGRNSIRIKSSSPSTYFTSKDKHYLILRPVSISPGKEWPNPIPDFVDLDELFYISQIIHQLTTEERQLSVGTSQFEVTATNPEDKTNDGNTDSDDAKRSSSSTSSSVPIPRFERFLLQMDSNKSYQVQQWLNSLQSSSNSIVEDIFEDLDWFQ